MPAGLTCGCSFHGDGRRPGGAGAQFPRRHNPISGAGPPGGLPILTRWPGPFRQRRFVLPLPPAPEPLGPGASQRQRLILQIRRCSHGWLAVPPAGRRRRLGKAGVRWLGARALPAAVPTGTLGSGKLQNLRAAVAASAATRPSRGLLLWALRLLLLPLLFLRGPGAAAACAPPLLQRLLTVRAPLRYSQACYYAGENGLLGRVLPSARQPRAC